jgi:hypothetical protein
MATITIEQVREFAQANPDLVQVKWNESGLGVVKYKNRVFYDGLWNEILEECRGMVIDKDWNIVSLPFTKIYNFGIEDRAPKLHHTDVVTVYDKINGFMAAATYHAATDQIVYSTTGSLNSDFVQYIKDSVAGYQDRIDNLVSSCMISSCCHESIDLIIDRHNISMVQLRGTIFNTKIVDLSEWERNNVPVLINHHASTFL